MRSRVLAKAFEMSNTDEPLAFVCVKVAMLSAISTQAAFASEILPHML